MVYSVIMANGGAPQPPTHGRTVSAATATPWKKTRGSAAANGLGSNPLSLILAGRTKHGKDEIVLGPYEYVVWLGLYSLEIGYWCVRSEGRSQALYPFSTYMQRPS